MRKFAFFLYLLFIVSWFLHPARRVEALGPLRIDLLLVVGIGVLMVLTSDQAPPKPDKRIRHILMTIGVYAVVTLPFVEWPGSVLRVGLQDFIKAVVFYYFTTELVSTEKQLHTLLKVFVACQIFRVVEPAYLHVTEGYWGSFAMMSNWETMNRLAGAPSDIINPNGLGFVILTALAFIHYLGPMSVWGGLLYVGFVPVALYALALTASRTGILGLAISLAIIWWYSRRKVLLAAAMMVVLIVAVPLLSGELRDRYLSIVSSSTKNSQTAAGRFEGVKSDFKVAMRRPLFGHGIGTSVEANANFNSRPEISHNLYTEVAQELGLVGLALMIWFLGTVALSVNQTLRDFRKSGINKGLILNLSLSLQVWYGINILSSFASYGLVSYEWYFLAGLAELLRRFSTAHAAIEVRPELVAVPRSAVRTAPGALRPIQGGSWSPRGLATSKRTFRPQ